ncbi:NAD(P)H-hydrate dehydratase, partial [Saprospiraceae bacterium]|nr:NAD(P)H-hydrate dehydratase [Saprospiraceae bacterium]
TSNALQLWELQTIKATEISAYNLMIKASTLFANWVCENKQTDNMSIAVLCGWGNNGGDGYAIAQILKNRNSSVKCYDLSFGREKSILCAKLCDEFQGEIISVSSIDDLSKLGSNSLVIDGIIGIGANRAFEKVMLHYVNHINANAKCILSIDIPSGMLPDGYTNHQTIEATETLTFTAPKLSFFSSTNQHRLGLWEYRKIGLPRETSTSKEEATFITLDLIRDKLKPRDRFAHKGTFGHCLIVGGQKGMAGAVVLASRSAYRCGAGLVTTASQSANRIILQISSPESIFKENDTPVFRINEERYSSIAIGPGLGISKESINQVKVLLNELTIHVILDADALNIIAQENLINKINKESILTPHPKEFDRLFGESANDFERRDKQKNASIEYNIYIILKGAFSTITTPSGDIYYNSTGNPGMAVGGSGDVLTGILTGLQAQGYSNLDVCILGVFLHGMAGDIAAKNLGEINMISSDIIKELSTALKAIQ